MRPLFSLLWLMVADHRAAFLRGAVLAIAVLVMGVALLGVSGWFITATAAAGLAGIGIAFDVFRPSAMIRLFALGRTAARYGERVLTHDATLRALSTLRVRLLSRTAEAPYDDLTHLRAGETLNRITADVDALDGVPLRFGLPVFAAVFTILATALMLWWLVDGRVALFVGFVFLVGGAVVAGLGIRSARNTSSRAEALAQDHRRALIDLFSAREDLAAYGQLATTVDAASGTEQIRRHAAQVLDRSERTTGAILSLVGAFAMVGVIWLGGTLAQEGTLSPAYMAVGIFAALALMEAIAPLRRLAADFGRMSDAASRVMARLNTAQAKDDLGQDAGQGDLAMTQIRYHRHAGAAPILSDFSLSLAAGTTTALVGSSGAGKSTVLSIAAGLLDPDAGTVTLAGQPITSLTTASLRAAVTLAPQRAMLMAGSIAQNLRLAEPAASDDDLWAALDHVALADVVRNKGGLMAMLGPRGAGLSGGEVRRLVLARALLVQPKVLLLDEPTEGLDAPTARLVLAGVRRALPNAAILIAAHRAEERGVADRVVTIAP